MATSRSVEDRVTRAGKDTLAEQHYVTAIDVLLRLGWLAPSHADLWRQGRLGCLEEMVQAGPEKQLTAMHTLRTWAIRHGLTPSETEYTARTRDRRRLRFSVSEHPDIEQAYRTHWVSPDLPERKAERLQAAANEPPDLVVVSALNEWTCAGCATTGNGLLLMQDGSRPTWRPGQPLIIRSAWPPGRDQRRSRRRAVRRR